MSATLPNLNIISDWLDAKLYQTDFRPIELMEYVKYENEIYNFDRSLVKKIEPDTRIENDSENLVQLVYETIIHKLGVLVFCPTKAR
jgi:DNA polymerase theta